MIQQSEPQLGHAMLRCPPAGEAVTEMMCQKLRASTSPRAGGLLLPDCASELNAERKDMDKSTQGNKLPAFFLPNAS
jgi:hypothetical protein